MIMEINSIHSRLTPKEQVLRDEIMAQLIAQHQPVDITAFTGKEAQDRDIISSLINKKVIVINAEGLVSFSYPVSALPSKHRVTLADGRWLYAMCAIDALGCAFTFAQDVNIFSACEHCNEPVQVEIKDGKIHHLSPHETHILHVDLNKIENWAATC